MLAHDLGDRRGGEELLQPQHVDERRLAPRHREDCADVALWLRHEELESRGVDAAVGATAVAREASGRGGQQQPGALYECDRAERLELERDAVGLAHLLRRERLRRLGRGRAAGTRGGGRRERIEVGGRGARRLLGERRRRLVGTACGGEDLVRAEARLEVLPVRAQRLERALPRKKTSDDLLDVCGFIYWACTCRAWSSSSSSWNECHSFASASNFG